MSQQLKLRLDDADQIGRIVPAQHASSANGLCIGVRNIQCNALARPAQVSGVPIYLQPTHAHSLAARQKAKSATFPWAFSMVKAFSKLKGKASPLTLEKLAVSSGGRQRTDSEAIAIRVRGEQRSYLLAVNFTEQSIEFLGHRLDGRAVLAVGEGDGWKTVLGVDVSSFDAR